MMFLKCSSLGCTGEFLIATDDVVFSCPICEKINCLKCKAVHEDETCDEYQVNLATCALVISNSLHLIGPTEASDDDVISNNNYSTRYECFDADCTGFGFAESAGVQFECSVCHHSNCLSCKAIHEFKTCTEYRQDKQNGNCTRADLAAVNELVDVIPNAEPFACPICLTDYEPGLGVILRQCLHHFCQDCLRNHITHSTDVEVKCPFVDPDNRHCESTLLPREIRALLSDAEHNKYLGRSLQVAESTIKNTFHCLTADCNGWCVVEDNVAEFICVACDKPNCLACKVIHEGQTCEEYVQTTPAYKLIESNDLSAAALDAMFRKGTAMKCTGCEAIIQKTSGCDGMQCSICKTHLCWATKGARWGPKGQGDITGGCRCRVNNKLCHPSCQNCH